MLAATVSAKKVWPGKVRRFAIAAILVLCLQACDADNAAAPISYEVHSVDATVTSRGVDIPVTYVYPVTANNDSYPLVVMAHGHGGTRHEAGGYKQLAEALAVRGIASIRMDFPGCGDSSESFAKNNLSNMLEDIRASRDYAISQPQVNAERVGLQGFSMGGRLTILTAAADDLYSVITLWAPSTANGAGSMIEFVGGQAEWEKMKGRADSEGFAPFTTLWGQDQQLGPQFFKDMEQSRPLDLIATITAPMLIVQGGEDEVVLPERSEVAVAAAGNSREVVYHLVHGADHGFGLFNDNPHYAEEAIRTTAEFFRERL